MMQWIGWVLFGLSLFWYVASQRLCQSKRLHLVNYIVSLLLADSIRNDHKAKLEQWIQKSNARDAADLGLQANHVIENMAETLAAGGSDPASSSTLGALATLWNSDAAAELRKNRR